MPVVRCGTAAVALDAGECVLDGLLRAGVGVAHSCRAGACQSCLVRATDGAPPPEAQVGLKETLRARGYFLACRALPGGDLTVATDDEGLQLPATISGVERLARDVVRVRLAPEGAFTYQAGQWINVRRDDGLTRSYSLASRPDEDGALELHVRVLPHGRMSNWLADPARVGERVTIRGPSGDCFYVAGRPEQPLVLAGTGTGLAPLYGVLRDALAAGHTGPIALVHGARTPAGLYLQPELLGLARAWPQLSYVRCVLDGDPAEGLDIGSLDAVLLRRWPRLHGARVFLCGDPALVLTLRKKAFLAGAALADIHSDAFVTAPPPIT
jgi:ferredoxin-NADP reductase/ferredoxin